MRGGGGGGGCERGPNYELLALQSDNQPPYLPVMKKK